jgi:D-alanyl-D-alanine carboxypeptidase/D-alanyl-D-alanine-endopeptidase (penicillin-binding protein 4)
MAKFEELNVQHSMRKILITFYFSLLAFDFFGQTVTQKLQKAFTVFEKDSQLKHAISSLYVIDANTGQVVFDKNSQIGLAPASTQKIITSVTAFELLGKDYRYKTELIFNNGYRIKDSIPASLILIKGLGDPTLGSWRYKATIDTAIINKWVGAIRKSSKGKFLLGIRVDDAETGDVSSVPSGYIWEDIGNYYGAGTSWINWRENQYDIIFKSDNTSYPTQIIRIEPKQEHVSFNNLVRSGEKGSGDNAYIYCPPYAKEAVIKGTIPPNQKNFEISGSMPDPAYTLGTTLRDQLLKNGVEIDSLVFTMRTEHVNDGYVPNYEFIPGSIHFSPTLDSIIYFFQQKSINLYGESLMRTMGYIKTMSTSVDSGIVAVQNFWKEKGLDEDELGIVDGSGLSPLNRVTTHSQVEILKYAKTKDWFPYFYNSLPEYNGMSMKSGTIRGVKGFCGYHKAKNGKEYIFSFLVNNYYGSSSSLVNKMYKVLNILK